MCAVQQKGLCVVGIVVVVVVGLDTVGSKKDHAFKRVARLLCDCDGPTWHSRARVERRKWAARSWARKRKGSLTTKGFEYGSVVWLGVVHRRVRWLTEHAVELDMGRMGKVTAAAACIYTMLGGTGVEQRHATTTTMTVEDDRGKRPYCIAPIGARKPEREGTSTGGVPSTQNTSNYYTPVPHVPKGSERKNTGTEETIIAGPGARYPAGKKIHCIRDFSIFTISR